MRRNKLVAHFDIGEAWDRFSKNNKKKVHNHTKTKEKWFLKFLENFY